jgi:hypothetical protein
MGDGLLAKRDIDKCREIAHNAQAVHDARSEGCHGREKRRNESHHGAHAGGPKKKVRPFTVESEEGATASRLLPQPPPLH